MKSQQEKKKLKKLYIMINIRASTIPFWADCPRRAAAKQWPQLLTDLGYVLKTTLPSIGGAVGTGVHSAGKYFFETKNNSGSLPPVSQGEQMAVESVELETVNGALYDTTTENQDTAKKQVVTLTRVFYKEVAEKMNFPDLEVARSGVLPGDVKITGHSDYENPEELDDLKTGAKAQNCSGQLGTYSLLRVSEGKKRPIRMAQFHLPRTSLKKPVPSVQIIPYDVKRAEITAWQIINHIAWCRKVFDKTKEPWAFLANPMSMMCSEKYCPVYKTEWCKEGK
jgi:hypothetical protein